MYKGPSYFHSIRNSTCVCPLFGRPDRFKKVKNLRGFQAIQSQLEGSGLGMRIEIVLLSSEERG